MSQTLDVTAIGVPSDRDVRMLNVASATKIRQRVSAVMRLLFPDLAEEPKAGALQLEGDTKAHDPTSTVVTLSAKSSAANKLISIVEIVKREVFKHKGSRQTTDKKNARGEAILFQYSLVRGVHEDTTALEDARQRSEAGRQAKRKREEGSSLEEAGQAPEKKRADTGGEKEGPDHAKSAEGEDQDEYFETMEVKQRAADVLKELESKPARETPMLSILLSRKAIKSLRETYGEQWV